MKKNHLADLDLKLGRTNRDEFSLFLSLSRGRNKHFLARAYLMGDNYTKKTFFLHSETQKNSNELSKVKEVRKFHLDANLRKWK